MEIKKELLEKMCLFIDKIEDTLRKDNGIEEIFFTSFGQEFVKKYLELMDFSFTASILPEPFDFGVRMANQEINQDTLEQIMHTLVQFMDKTDMSNENKTKAKEIINKAKEKIVELIQLANEFSDLFPKMDEEIIEEAKAEISDKNESEEELVNKNFIRQIPPRLNAYFILALYAYLELYSMALLKYVINMLPPEEIFRTLNKIKGNISNPINTIDTAINILNGFINIDLKKEILEKVIKEKGWTKYVDSLKNFKELRNHIAHKGPFIELSELANKFPFYHESAKIKLENAISELINTEIQVPFGEYIKSLFLGMIDWLEIGYLLQEIGKGCIRYIAMTDYLIFRLQQSITTYE